MQDVRYEVPSYGVVACFLTNLIFVASGSGFLNFPFVVWHSGVVYLLLTIAVFAFLSTATSMWVLETLARTEGLMRIEANEKSGGPIDKSSPTWPFSLCEISSRNRYEFCDLAHIYFGRLASAAVALVLISYLFLVFWISCIPAGTALATVLPFSGDTLSQCASSDFRLAIHPDGPCWNLYAISILMLVVVIVFGFLFELGHLEVVQWVVGSMRLVILIAIIVYSFFGSKSTQESMPWTSFDLAGWLKGVSVCSFYYLCCLNLPCIVQPLKDKSKMFSIIIATTIALSLMYSIVGITVAMRFGSKVTEFAATNWADLTGAEHSTGLRILSYAVLLFPSFDTFWSGFTAVAILTNTLESQFFVGKFTLADRAVCRILVGIVSATCSIYITNMVTVIKIIACFAIIVSGLLPAALQLKSRTVWKCTLGKHGFPIGHRDTPYSSWFGHKYCVGVCLICLLLIPVALIGGFVTF